MLKVSERWQQAQLEVPRPAPKIRVSMYVIDPATVGDAKVQVFDPYIFFSNPQQIMTLEEVEQNYATCEKNFWKLDGSMRLLPDQADIYEEAGLVYEELTHENEDGDYVLSFEPKIIITFRQKFDAIGLTLNFDYLNEGFATDFRVRAYSDDELLLDETIHSNSPRNEVPIYVDGFNKVEFDLYKFNRPFYRPRVFDVLTGLIKIWDNTNLLSSTYTGELSMTSSALPSDVLDITVNNESLVFNPEDLKIDSWRYFLENQPVLLEYGFQYSETTSEYIRKAYLYLTKWKNNERTAEFTAKGQFHFMKDKYYKGNFGTKTLYQLAEDVLFDLELPLNSDTTYKWRLDESLKNFTCSNPLPVDTHASLLSMIAQAAGCIMWQDNKANIYIQKRSTELIDYVERKDRTTSYVEIDFDPTLKNVLVNVYSYTISDQTTQLFSGEVEPGHVYIEFSSQASDVQISIENGSYSNAQIYAGACTMTVTGTNPIVTVSGRRLEYSFTTKTVEYETFGDNAEIDNRLITNFNTAQNVATFVGDYLINRRTYARTDKGEPALQYGDIITSQNAFTNGRPTIVTKQTIKLGSDGTIGELEEREVTLDD